MTQHVLSRRTLLTATGLGAAAFFLGCDVADVPASITPITNPPKASPFLPGPYQVGQVILGEDNGTKALPQPLSRSELADITSPPSSVLAVVYFPYFAGTDHRVPTPNPLHITQGPFPLLLYAHAYRQDNTHVDPSIRDSPLSNRDFTSVDVMLRHVASYGCVCLVPDLSWLPDMAWDARAEVLVGYYQYLASVLNNALFANQVDLSRVILVGHSTGAGGATHAGRDLTSRLGVTPVAFGLIAPESGGDSGPDIRNLVVLGGTLDLDEGADPSKAYTTGGTPKTLVMIDQANHFGYTGICPLDNDCRLREVIDEKGGISRAAQQQTGAAYLTALMRFYAQGDATARPYLTGEERVEGLEVYGVGAIDVQSQGLPLSTPTPSRVTPAPFEP